MPVFIKVESEGHPHFNRQVSLTVEFPIDNTQYHRIIDELGRSIDRLVALGAVMKEDDDQDDEIVNS
jgi:hypothetical protein